MTKRVIPIAEFVGLPEDATCAYKPCDNKIAWAVRHELDGSIESEYFVCHGHKPYEDGSRILGL